jgi:hypothetical protein
LVAACLVVWLGAPRPARADKIDRLSAQLKSASSYKVRLSAALALSKLSDQRAIPALLVGLSDGEKTVRGVAAAGLAKVVDTSTSDGRKRQVLAALDRVRRGDKNPFVRRQAEKAYNAIKGASSAGAGSVFVDVGSMGDKTGKNATLKKLMQDTVAKTFRKKASTYQIGIAGKARPGRNANAFHVDGTLTALTVSARGRSSEVACKVSMLIATFPQKSMFGFLNGGARVTTGSSSRDQAFGKQDCVAAVVEDLVHRKVIPTLESRTK